MLPSFKYIKFIHVFIVLDIVPSDALHKYDKCFTSKFLLNLTIVKIKDSNDVKCRFLPLVSCSLLALLLLYKTIFSPCEPGSVWWAYFKTAINESG